jgi:hypothetical protein
MDCDNELQGLSIVAYSNHVHTTILQQVFFFFFLISKNFIEKTKYIGRIVGKEYKKAQIEQ